MSDLSLRRTGNIKIMINVLMLTKKAIYGTRFMNLMSEIQNFLMENLKLLGLILREHSKPPLLGMLLSNGYFLLIFRTALLFF